MSVFLLPGAVFCVLALLEFFAPRQRSQTLGPGDHVLNMSGIIVQGAITPLVTFFAVSEILQPAFPGGAGTLPLGFWGAFLLNVVVIDFIYYWQHRAFHQLPALWRFHVCHHAAPKVDVWATSRNSLPTHFMFVYFLVNPWVGYLCDNPAGFFAGAMLTAALDVFRHSNVDYRRFGMAGFLDVAGRVFVTPAHHHRHHASGIQMANYGANFIVWDRVFGTFDGDVGYPKRYGVDSAPSFWQQLRGAANSGLRPLE